MKAKFRLFLKNIAYTVLINLFVILCLAYGTEIYLRNNDPFLDLPFDTFYYLGYPARYQGKITPPADLNDYIYTWGHKVVNNKFEMREKEFATPKPEGTIRIMVLGDSFTWGAGLAKNERYSDRLDSMLNTEFPQRKWEVVNFGFPGGPTVREMEMLRKVKDEVQPDFIIVGFCTNDPQPLSEGYSIEQDMFAQRYGSKIDFFKHGMQLIGLTYFADLVESYIYKINERMGYIPEWEIALNRTYNKNSSQWKVFTQSLADIKNMSDSMNCPTPIFAAFNSIGSIPIPEKVSDHNSRDKYFKLRYGWIMQARTAADSIGFTTINYDQEFAKRLNDGSLTFEQLVLNPLDGHPSAEMNKLYADLIFNAMKEKVVPKLEKLQ